MELYHLLCFTVIPLKMNLFNMLLIEPAVSSASERYLLVYMIFVLFGLTVFVIVFFIVFQNRKNKLLTERFEQQQLFDEELVKSTMEIQEQTLKHLGWELHDNVGQLLAYANMQLNMIKSKAPEALKPQVSETVLTLKESLQEVRALSKSLNNEVLLQIGLIPSIENELNRIRRMKFEDAVIVVKGEIVAFENKKHEIILFRILQEFFSNAVKYSNAKVITVILEFQDNHLIITASDDGVGFEINDNIQKGSGLLNMRSRAVLIGATFNIESEPKAGVKLTLNYPLK